jgi:DNA polymerase III epsilon subunit-like protein
MYHEHHYFQPDGLMLSGTAVATLQQRFSGYWFHPDPEKCRTCSPRLETASPGVPKFVVYDTETTGSSKTDIVIQLGFVAFDSFGKEIRRYEEVWRSDKRSSPMAEKVHGIQHSEVQASRTEAAGGLTDFQQILCELRDNQGVLVAHNAAFDHRMVQQTADRAGIKLDWCAKEFCTAKALRTRSDTERGPNCKNSQVYSHIGGLPLGKMHRALVDARATAHIFFHGQDMGWW